jgi:hypothetical protein
MEEPSPDNYDKMRRNNLIVIVAVILLALALFATVQKIKHSVLPQNCHMAGFVNCSWTYFPHA